MKSKVKLNYFVLLQILSYRWKLLKVNRILFQNSNLVILKIVFCFNLSAVLKTHNCVN